MPGRSARGWTTIAIKVEVYNRLENHLAHKKESWNDVVDRILTTYEEGLKHAR